jgi:hypothetical protein
MLVRLLLSSQVAFSYSTPYATLSQFVKGNPNCFVVEWKDQSGNANHATQNAAANQPKIYDGTTGVVTKDGNNLTTLNFQTNGRMGTSLTLNTEPISVFAVNQTPNGNGRQIVGLGGSAAYSNLEIQNYVNSLFRIYAGDGSTFNEYNSSSGASTDVVLFSYLKSGNSITAYGDGSLELTATETKSSSGALSIGAREFNDTAYISEVIVYDSDQSSNRSNIEDNINTFYSIY